MILEQFSRTILLLGNEKFEKIINSHVLVVGLGGVGGYAVEQLCRAGIGEITIIDADIVNESNINRQIIALKSTAGKLKTEIFEQRLKDINPEVKINSISEFFTPKHFETFFNNKKFDYVVDAIDTLAPKISLIKACLANKIPLVSSMGSGGKFNPTEVKISDISKSYNCHLARFVRKRLHKTGITKGFKVVFSSEITNKEAIVLEKSENKNSNVGTISYMPAMFGLYCAYAVLSDLSQ
jgi:tRNA A37 threonylcarbamoyladenosine dehydratase